MRDDARGVRGLQSTIHENNRTPVGGRPQVLGVSRCLVMEHEPRGLARERMVFARKKTVPWHKRDGDEGGNLRAPKRSCWRTDFAPQISPSFILPSSLIIDWFQAGSQVMRTSAAATPGTSRILVLASSAIAGPMPQPGAVNVMATSTL